MIVSRVRIEDFERFWATFSTRGLAKRREHGSRGARLFRSADDPQVMVTLFDWDREGWEAFMRDPEVVEIMRSAGLRHPPEPTFLEPVDELEA
jgi:hypothetical protein